jgi:hypothetical protein
VAAVVRRWEVDMRAWRVVYWSVTGAILGLGLVSLPGLSLIFPGLGLILVPIGVILLLIGLIRVRGLEGATTFARISISWAVDFVVAIVTYPRRMDPIVQFYYYGGIVIFGIYGLISTVIPVVAWRARRRGAGPTAN